MPESTSKTRELAFARPLIGDEERQAVAEVLSGHVLTHGPKCAAFEAAFAKRIGARHAITTSSCTTALHLALLAHDIGPGDEVIVPAETHVATGHVVEHCGARPIFVDVEADTGNIDPETVSRAITERTRAIMVVHYLGLPVDMDAIRQTAGAIPIIEDCAIALGASWNDEAPGALGAAGAFSFYPSKHITTMEGGMFTTNSDEIAARVRKQRAFGYDKNFGERTLPGIYDIDMLGYNYRMSEAQAAVGSAQLAKLDGFLETRRQNAETLISRVGEIEELTTFVTQKGAARSSHYCLNIVLPDDTAFDRGELILALNADGVGTSVHYPVALPLSKFYSTKYGYKESDFPVAKWISDKTVSLPVGPHLDIDDMNYIGDCLKSAVAKARR
jgi:perosamine synthetase